MENITHNKVILLKAIEETDEQMAIDILSNPNLDGRELSEIIQCSMDKKIIDKETGEPMQLNTKVLMAGIRNRFNQLANENK